MIDQRYWLERINNNIIRANELLAEANEWCKHIGNENQFIVTLAPPEPKEKNDKGTGDRERSDKNGDRDSAVPKLRKKDRVDENPKRKIHAGDDGTKKPLRRLSQRHKI